MSSVGVFGNGSIWTIMKSSTKQYPTSLVVSPEMHHLKANTCPDYLRQLSIGLLTIVHMAGDEQFPYPKHLVGVFRGTAHVYPP